MLHDREGNEFLTFGNLKMYCTYKACLQALVIISNDPFPERNVTKYNQALSIFMSNEEDVYKKIILSYFYATMCHMVIMK